MFVLNINNDDANGHFFFTLPLWESHVDYVQSDTYCSGLRAKANVLGHRTMLLYENGPEFNGEGGAILLGYFTEQLWLI